MELLLANWASAYILRSNVLLIMYMCFVPGKHLFCVVFNIFVVITD